MKEGNFVPKDTSFDALVGGLGLEVLRPSARPVLYLLPAPRPLLSPEGALLLFRPQEGLYRYRNAAGFPQYGHGSIRLPALFNDPNESE